MAIVREERMAALGKEPPKWEVRFSSSAAKQKKKLPEKISEALARLTHENAPY